MSYVWLHQVNETQYRYQLPRDNDPSVLHGCQKYCNCRKIHIKQQMQHFKKCTISCWRILLSLSLLFQKLLSSEMFNNSVIRNFIANSFTPSSSSSDPRFQGFFNVLLFLLSVQMLMQTSTTILVSFSLYLPYLPLPFHQIQHAIYDFVIGISTFHRQFLLVRTLTSQKWF